MNNLRNRSRLRGHLPAGNRIGAMLTDSLQLTAATVFSEQIDKESGP